MNLILINKKQDQIVLAPDDRRFKHIKNVLLPANPEYIRVGVLNGPIGLALVKNAGEGLELSISWDHSEEQPPEPEAIDLWVPFCRPQTCRKLLRELPSLGVRNAKFYLSERTEPSYRESRLWRTKEWERQLMIGMEQAYTTHVTGIDLLDHTLKASVLSESNGTVLALDNYESIGSLLEYSDSQLPLTLIFGGERGFSPGERNHLRSLDIPIVHLGRRVMKVETAVVYSLGVLSGRLQT